MGELNLHLILLIQLADRKLTGRAECYRNFKVSMIMGIKLVLNTIRTFISVVMLIALSDTHISLQYTWVSAKNIFTSHLGSICGNKEIYLSFFQGFFFSNLSLTFYQLLTATIYAHTNLYCHQSFIDLHENSRNLEIYVT